MEYALKASEMKACDQNTVTRIGIPSLVLMERAALAACQEAEGLIPGKGRVLVIAGSGNNGGDGLAVGRLRALAGKQVTFFMAGDSKKLTEETRAQIKILENLGFSIQGKLEAAEYDMVIDAFFGIGLSREIAGDACQVIGRMNFYKSQGAFILSLDIPSGICADTGRIMGCAVRADLTVAFAFAKRGHLLYPGREYCGRLKIKDIGIPRKAFGSTLPAAFYYEIEDAAGLLPKRAPAGNKGTFGKGLVVAGSRDMCGACLLCGRSLLKTGAGMARIISPSCNRTVIQQGIPEAVLSAFDGTPSGEKVKESLAWADAVVAGPGLGMGEEAYLLMKYLLEDTAIPMVVDADGLNLIAANGSLQELAARRQAQKLVLTPHPGELARLLNIQVQEVLKDREGAARKLAGRFSCVVVAKDAATIVVAPGEERMYINVSGNDGMASAGSGDVLAGITGGLLAQGMSAFQAASLGSYLHGLAGDYAAREKGRYGMTAGDIACSIPFVMKSLENCSA